MMYERPFDSLRLPSSCQTPSDFSSYVLDARIIMAMGKIAMYIITTKLNWTAGLTLARLKVDVPVWREEAA